MDCSRSARRSCRVGAAAERPPERRLGERGDAQKRRRCLRRVPRLSPVIVSLEANSRTDGGVIFWAAFAQLGGGAGKVCAKAARFDDRDLHAERSDLFGQRLRKTLNPELCSRVRCAPCWSDASCDRGYLDDVSGPALTKVRQHSLGHDDDTK